MARCGLYNNSGDLQPLQSVDVSCTVREDFACQVKLTQIFTTNSPKTSTLIDVVDTDGDKIEFRLASNGSIQQFVNGKLELRKVTSFEFDCNSGEYVDAGGTGKIPAADRLLFARKLMWFFQTAKLLHCLTIENEPEGGLKPLSGNEIPRNLIETSYYFPLDGNAAVYAFRATLQDGSVVDGIVQEKNEAKQTYETAKKAGKTAFLMEREKSDIFQISLGNVTAGESIKIEISYIAELEMRDGRIRLRIPNRIAPKYGGGPSTRVDYPISFDFAIRTSTRIGKIEALGGVDVQTALVPGDEKAARVTASKEGFMNEDLVLMISQDSPYGVYTTFERSYELKSECLRLTFNNPINTDSDMDGKCEIIFLVDKSGSMSGDRMETTKFALTLFLRSLPEESRFNIVAFDRRWSSCFDKSNAYNDDSLRSAQRCVDNISASGGTNINGPLEEVLAIDEDPDYPRSIILLTDGEVRDTKQCIETARRGGCRVFTIGVGRSFSQELVEGIAAASNGSWLAVHNTEDMGNVVMQMLGNALTPVVCKCKADMGPFGKAEMWPSKFPQLMDGVRSTLYWVRPMQEEGSEDLPPKFTITLDGYYNNGDAFKKELQVITGDFEGITESQLNRSKQEVDSIVHRVAALSKIKKLELQREGKKQKEQIRELGLKYNLATSETSFVAVRNRDDASATEKSTHGEVIVGESPPEQKRERGSLNDRRSRRAPKRSRKKKSKSAPQYHSFGLKTRSIGGTWGAANLDTALEYGAASRDVSNCRGAEVESNYSMSLSGFASWGKRRTEGAPRVSESMAMKSNDLFQDSMDDLCELDSLQADECLADLPSLDVSKPMKIEDLPIKQKLLDDEDELLQLMEGTDLSTSKEPSKMPLDFNWLLSQQSASGMFTFAPSDSRFATFSAKNINVAVAQKLKDQGVLNTVLATLFALAALEHNFPARQKEWRFMFTKGKRWVQKQLTNKNDFDSLFALLA